MPPQQAECYSHPCKPETNRRNALGQASDEPRVSVLSPLRDFSLTCAGLLPTLEKKMQPESTGLTSNGNSQREARGNTGL